MAYFYQKNYNGKQVPYTVHENDKDKGMHIFIFFCDETYIGAVRYYVGGRYYNIIDDYSSNVINIDFEEEVQYFFDIIYGLDR